MTIRKADKRNRSGGIFCVSDDFPASRDLINP